MKVLLVSTNTMMEPYPPYPIGLDYVMNAISPPHQVKIADMNELKDGDALAGVLSRYQPDIIGLSIRNIDNIDEANTKTFIGEIRDLIGIIREHSGGFIVLGGSGFTILPGEFMSRLDADFGIIGEGERLQFLLQALERNESVSGLPGIVTMDSPVVFPEPWPRSFHRSFFRDHSHASFYLKRGGMLNLQTKRGCPFKCIYCTYPHIEGTRFRFAPPGEIAATARMLQDAGAGYIYITDSTFNGSAEQSLEVAAAFKKSGISVPWGGFFTPLSPSPDYYCILADAGLMHVEFGTEALSNSMLASYRKPFRLEDVFTSHRLAVAAGLHVAHYLMLGGPGEDEGTLKETLANADELEKAVFFVFGGVRIYPHTALYDLALKERQIERSRNLLEPAFYWSPALHRETVMDIVKEHAGSRANWVFGSGSQQTLKNLARLHARGRVGPLWEQVIW
ncbi:MAG: B12-binding domain-containing radical SAM protein [Syntrophobacterales bacterium CG23_combo_of_CG06-09_8_20_14_all_48_27]|nr:MAG: B12-binding domain-containing radical SAM protein [Syntrophobacterales bacterium CG23_combo_of_CG06-09_8_20_14_all_48_27]